MIKNRKRCKRLENTQLSRILNLSLEYYKLSQSAQYKTPFMSAFDHQIITTF